MINQEEVFRIGKIIRTHGIGGELEVQYTDDVFEKGEAEYFVLMLDGILVPFFWDEYRYKGSESIIVKFEGIDTDVIAKRYVGTAVYYPKASVSDNAEDGVLSSYKALTGFALYDADNHEVGVIDGVDDSTQNTLLYVKTKSGAEAILPYHDDFLIDFDYRKRTITLQIPDGLLP